MRSIAGLVLSAVATMAALMVVNLGSSSPLAHPSLLDLHVSGPYHLAFAGLATVAAACLMWPMARQDPVVRFVSTLPNEARLLRVRFATPSP